MTRLLDGNLLVALRIDTHVGHDAAQRLFSRHRRDRFATCPVTQGTLLRVHMRSALDGSVDAAWEALREINEHPNHEFWADNFSYLDVPHRWLQGPSQVTDAWLAELARRRKGKTRDIRPSTGCVAPRRRSAGPVSLGVMGITPTSSGAP